MLIGLPRLETIRSAPDGSFSIRPVPPGRYLLRVDPGPGRAYVRVVEVPADGDLALDTIRLRPIHPGRLEWTPGPRACRDLRLRIHIATGPAKDAVVAKVYGDQSGFELPHLSPGRYRLSVVDTSDCTDPAPTWITEPLTIDAAGNQSLVWIRLP